MDWKIKYKLALILVKTISLLLADHLTDKILINRVENALPPHPQARVLNVVLGSLVPEVALWWWLSFSWHHMSFPLHQLGKRDVSGAFVSVTSSSPFIKRCIKHSLQGYSNHTGFLFKVFHLIEQNNHIRIHCCLYRTHCFRKILPAKVLLAIKWIKYQCCATSYTPDVTKPFWKLYPSTGAMWEIGPELLQSHKQDSN